MTKKRGSQPVPKDRGWMLSVWLVLMAIHGVVFSYLIYYLRQDQGWNSPAWMMATLFILSLAKVVAAVGMWFWKKWGLTLYIIAVVVGMAVGLMLTGTQLIVFHDVILLVITGFLIKDKRNYFD